MTSFTETKCMICVRYEEKNRLTYFRKFSLKQDQALGTTFSGVSLTPVTILKKYTGSNIKNIFDIIWYWDGIFIA